MSRKMEGPWFGQNTIRKLAVGYVRVSTKNQGDNGISLEAQKVAIETFADRAGYTLIEIFEDVASGVGVKSFQQRQGLTYALDLAVREDADLLVWDLDRLTRYSGFHNQVRKALPDGDRIVCVKHWDRMQNASLSAISAHDEEVANRISRATKKAMKKKRAAGVVFGNPMILTDAQPHGVAANSNFAHDLVHRIADVLREYDDPFTPTYADVSDILNAKGIRTGHGQEWTASRARIPVKKARDLLKKEEQEALQSLPTFGMF